MPDAAPLDCPDCRFGRFELRAADRLLLADGHVVVIGGRAFDLLIALVAHAGRLVSKSKLLMLVWQGMVVEENNLQVQISALRKLLGRDALATVPGRGYRFDLKVQGVRGAKPVLASTPGEPAFDGAAVARARSNLPARIAPLYGRASEVDAVLALMHRHAVATIVGAGGIGKTSVAQAVAARIAADRAAEFPDGVWWVELVAVADGASVASAVARVLGAQISTERPAVETVAAVLAPLRLLLVLDNCEHLTDAVASLVDTLTAAAPGLQVLATSQESLKARGEQVYRLGTLAVPASDADASQAGAVELFVARAQSVSPWFTLSTENTAAVVEVCRRLDGIPLAIELAAARMPLLGAEGLRARLGEPFKVLTGRARKPLGRHQTLRATLEWSHGLLTPDEQTVFRRLCVFAGNFTLAAAQHVVQDARIDAWAALDLLGVLVDKSLVLAEGDPVPRYRLLETSRAYALERLDAAGESDAVRLRHAQALLSLLTSVETVDLSLDALYAGAMAGAVAELDNLRQALAWSAGTAEGAELAIALAGESFAVWSGAHLQSEGLVCLLGLRPRLQGGLPPTIVARYWLNLAELGMFSTRRECYDAAHIAADLYRQLGDNGLLFDALIQGAAQGIRFGTLEAIALCIEEATGLVGPNWSATRRAMLEFVRWRWLCAQSRFDEAIAAAQRQVEYLQHGGHEIAMHKRSVCHAYVESQLGQDDAALAHAQSAIARLEILGAGFETGHLWVIVATTHIMLGQINDAVAACRTGYAMLVRIGDQLRMFKVFALCAAVQGRLGDAARTVGFIEAARALVGSMGDSQWTRTNDRLNGLLVAGLSPEELAAFKAEGAAMTESAIAKLALGAP